MAIPTQAGKTRAGFGLPVTDVTMIAVVMIWGLNFSAMKIGLREIPPLAFAGLRFAGASVLLWLLLVWREGPLRLPQGTLWKLTWVGLVGNTLYQLGFTYGLRITSAANASLLIATTPALVAFFGALLGIERLRRHTIAGIILAFLGVALVVASGQLHFTTKSLPGDLLLFGCAVCWTIYTLGVRTLAQGLSPLAITTWTTITGAPALLLMGIPDLLRLEWAGVGAGAWASLAYATAIALVVAYALWNNSVRVAGSVRTSIYGCAIPFCAALLAWPLLGEQPTWNQAAGAVLIVAGVLLTRRW